MMAGKHFDPVMGIDIHIILTPAGVPVPVPHPYIGFLIDPFDYIPIVGSTVIVNGIHRAQAGTAGKCVPPHIPIGGSFTKPPANECEMFMGSATVEVDGDAFSYLALPALSCHCVGMVCPPRLNPKKKSKVKSLVLPTSLVTPIPAGMPVLVGGPPTISLMALGMRAGMAGMGKAFKKLRKLQKGSKRMKGISNKLHKAAKKGMDKLGVPPSVQNRIHRGICSVTGHPVDIATGKVFTETVDFELPGPLPLKWERVYYSTSSYQGPLGHGWHHSYDLALTEDRAEGAVAVRLADGRSVAFPQLQVGQTHRDERERLTLARDAAGYTLTDVQGLAWRFADTTYSEIQPLESVSDRAGNRIQFGYDDRGTLRTIRDSGDRLLEVVPDEAGRILEIRGPHPEQVGQQIRLLRHQYDQNGNLVEVRDVLDQPMRFVYAGHQLVQETDRNGLSFYFEYDGPGHQARCIHTWGDDGIYNHSLAYDKPQQATAVTNSLGQTTLHYWEESGLVTRTEDPLGHVTTTTYDACNRLLEQVDELGQATTYEYDERGNQTLVTQPDGATVAIQYNQQDLPINARDAAGGSWQWEYNSPGQLIERTDPTGRTTRFSYAHGRLAEIVDPAGNITELMYDEAGNLSSIRTADGARTVWAYDRLGRPVTVTDPSGNIQRRTFDLAGQVNRVEEADGNLRSLAYDPQGNVTHAQDRQHDVRFSYQGMGRLASRTEAGTTVRFEYNTEEDLTGVVNEQGHVYQFELDALGNVAVESGFDGIRRVYTRDAAGRISQVERASGLVSAYAYDPAGRVIALNHSDGAEESYVYREDGELVEAANPVCSVRFERDEVGRILKEWQDDYWVSSSYDANGLRTEMRSCFGAIQKIERDAVGDVTAIRYQDAQSADPVSTAWDARITRDMLGLELERSLPGGVRSRWKRDKLGRPIRHQILGGGDQSRDVQYEWDTNDRLKKIVDAHHGTTVFDHDAIGNLASATYGDGTIDLRMPDAVGNLFREHDRSDRKYGAAGEILESRSDEGITRYEYDAEGNLIRKSTPQGDWLYTWNAAGMLDSVKRPDGQLVEFEYDPLGRRISKTFRGKTTHWIWDGNNPLHEWTEGGTDDEPVTSATAASQTTAKPPLQEELVGHPPTGPPDGVELGTAPKGLITWLFDPESFAPAAKLVDGQRYSIVTDYLGTPTAMLDSTGQTVWSADISIYGDLRNLTGNRYACPFRWPGQYEDEETGLYYNRFRYYDPAAGGYMSQDPIRLLGGTALYTYVSDPLAWTDPLGLQRCYGKVDPSHSRIKAYGYIYDGDLEIEMRMRLRDGTRGSLRGVDEFRNIIEAGGSRVNRIKGSWSYGDNLDSFNRSVSNGVSPEDAARNTWTGQQAGRSGFGNVDQIRTQGEPGAYEKVEVWFSRN
ncbi:MAG TPA: hypothetical protein DCE55_12280 [Planctomycetaceae bacterium]|nr:hypothetical protein [Planctomycetaceae bacterium]